MLGVITFALNIVLAIGYMLVLGLLGVTVASVVGVSLSVAILAYLYTETCVRPWAMGTGSTRATRPMPPRRRT